MPVGRMLRDICWRCNAQYRVFSQAPNLGGLCDECARRVRGADLATLVSEDLARVKEHIRSLERPPKGVSKAERQRLRGQLANANFALAYQPQRDVNHKAALRYFSAYSTPKALELILDDRRNGHAGGAPMVATRAEILKAAAEVDAERSKMEDYMAGTMPGDGSHDETLGALWSLAGPWLANADLVGIDLSGARLVAAVFDGANLAGANLSSAAFYVDEGHGFSFKCSFEGADCSQVSFAGADLRKANCRGMKARDASFVQADLRGAVLTGADLTGADLSGTKLDGADLR
jgi:uncharacterized protein YjbI with pentapeptide repeats